MKAFIASLMTETNEFSPFPTGYDDFGFLEGAANNNSEEAMIFRGEGKAQKAENFYGFFNQLLNRIDQYGWENAFSILAYAQPAGPTTKSVYESLRDEIINDLRHAMPVDVIYLYLHGAMIADGYNDCEGDLLMHVRKLAGESVKIGILLDPHCHLSEEMIDFSDLIVCLKEYPHTDSLDRGLELLDLLGKTARKEINPVISCFDCRMLSAYYTDQEPMQSFVAEMKAAEGVGATLHLSLAHGFPWADVPFMGAKMLVTTDNDKSTGDMLAEKFGKRLFELRGRTIKQPLSLSQAVAIAESDRSGTVIMSDWTDVSGGGAPSDSTYILEQFVLNNVRNAAVAFIYDPGSVSICHKAGVGARLNLRIGGKVCRFSGQPLDLDVVVTALKRDFVERYDDSFMAPFGDIAAVRYNDVDILLCSVREQPRTQQSLQILNIEPSEKQTIVLKGMRHWRHYYADISSETYDVDAGGLLTTDFEKISYKNLARPKWPFDDDPFEPKLKN